MSAWKKPNTHRAPWFIACEDYPPYEYQRSKSMREDEYHGYRIVEQKYNGAFDKSDTMGFEPNVVYVVLDDFDDPILPFSHHQFWSPWDARNAIDFHEWFKAERGKRYFPSTASHDFNYVMQYRRRPNAVYAAVQDLKKIVRSARDFDENPSQAIMDRIALLETELQAW